MNITTFFLLPLLRSDLVPHSYNLECRTGIINNFQSYHSMVTHSCRNSSRGSPCILQAWQSIMLKVQPLSQMNIVRLSIASHLHLSGSVQSQLHPLHCAVHTHTQASDISASSTESLCSIVPQLKHHSTHQCNVMMTNEMTVKCYWLTLTLRVQQQTF